MNPEKIHEKFGGIYIASERTFRMGIDKRFTTHFAQRFRHMNVLETCTGGGFTTLSLAGTARHVFTVEIDRQCQTQAIANLAKAGLSNRVSFIHGDTMDKNLLHHIQPVDAAFIDPDWAVSGPHHVFRFLDSNTEPPADRLLATIFEITPNVALVLPPIIDRKELDGLRPHEREKLYLGDRQELFCLYFGDLVTELGETEYRIPG